MERVKWFLLPSPTHQTHFVLLLFVLFCFAYFVFAPAVCWNFSAANQNFTNVFSSVGHCLRQCFPRDPVPRETTAGYTLGTKVCMPNMQYTGGPGSSQVPWYMVLDPKDPTKALSSMNRCQVVEMESDKGCLIWPCC